MSFLTKLERLFGRFAIPNLSLYLIVGQVFFWGLALMTGFDLGRIALLPVAVVAGEVWRVATFVLVPPNIHPVFIAFAWYLFYLMGTALEHNWGAFRYNAFLGIGWLLTVAAAFVTPFAYATNYYFLRSVFLAFAYLNPDFVMMIFFILPVKIKWLALLQWLGYGYRPHGRAMVRPAGGARRHRQLPPLFRRRHRQPGSAPAAGAWRTRRRSLPPARTRTEHRHRCRVCGKTDLSDPKDGFPLLLQVRRQPVLLPGSHFQPRARAGG